MEKCLPLSARVRSAPSRRLRRRRDMEPSTGPGDGSVERHEAQPLLAVENLTRHFPVMQGVFRRERGILRGDVPSPADPPAGCRFSTRCPMAASECSARAPDWRELRPGHWAACHFAQ